MPRTLVFRVTRFCRFLRNVGDLGVTLFNNFMEAADFVVAFLCLMLIMPSDGLAVKNIARDWIGDYCKWLSFNLLQNVVSQWQRKNRSAGLLVFVSNQSLNGYKKIQASRARHI